MHGSTEASSTSKFNVANVLGRFRRHAHCWVDGCKFLDVEEQVTMGLASAGELPTGSLRLNALQFAPTSLLPLWGRPVVAAPTIAVDIDRKQ